MNVFTGLSVILSSACRFKINFNGEMAKYLCKCSFDVAIKINFIVLFL